MATDLLIQLEDSLFAEFGPLLRMVGIDPTTVNGSRVPTSGLNRPVVLAVQELGYSVANQFVLSDTDLVQVAADKQSRLWDELAVRILETILNRWDGYNFTAGSENSKSLGDMKKLILDQLNAKRAEVNRRYPVETEDEAVFGGIVRTKLRFGTRFRSCRGEV